ncbi:BBE domain-containing protein [Nocardia sp. NPDC059091]|uniref:BBE domain-containing protein n=1 Tax=unclassified Nocardia TaxID=2637762 RepID=UPI00367F21A0
MLCWTPADAVAGLAAGRDLIASLPTGYCAAILAVSGPPEPFFLVDHDQRRIRESYGDKYSRLVALKAAWDPDNVFHHNANIPPA